MKINSLNLKYLLRAHTILGLFALFFFYLASFFGTITVFLPYLKSWESPSRHFVAVEKNINLDLVVPKIMQRHELTDIIEVSLPSFREKAIGINDQQSKTIYVNPNTNEVLNIDFETNFLTTFFNDIHIGTNIPVIGRYLMGFASILMIFLSISGVIMWINMRRKGGKKEKFWLKWHKNITLALLPLILAFSFTGAVLGFMLSSATPIAYSASKTENPSLRALVGPILFPKDKKVQESQTASMMKISQLQEIAKKEFPNLQIDQIKLFAWNDLNAKAKFSGHLKDNRALSGRVNRMHIEISAVTGEVIKKHDLSTATNANKILSAFYFLHFIPDETLTVRVFYFIMGILLTASLAFGFLIYSDKKAKSAKSDESYYSILNKISIAVMIGVIPATTLVIFLYWYFPLNMFEQPIWLKGSFYSLWALTFLYIAFNKNTLKVISHLLLLSSALLILAIGAHGVATGYYPWISFEKGLMDIFFVDMVLFLFATIFFAFSKKLENISILEKYKKDEYVY